MRDPRRTNRTKRTKRQKRRVGDSPVPNLRALSSQLPSPFSRTSTTNCSLSPSVQFGFRFPVLARDSIVYVYTAVHTIHSAE